MTKKRMYWPCLTYMQAQRFAYRLRRQGFTAIILPSLSGAYEWKVFVLRARAE